MMPSRRGARSRASQTSRWPHNGPPAKAERNIQIARLHDEGLSDGAIGKRFGLSRTRVRNIYQRHERMQARLVALANLIK
jgi:DNA-binding NarL/FixJ family response regulator